jgi:putative CocE/NonD family hydrolase
MELSWQMKAMIRLRYWLKGNIMDAPSRTEWLGEMLKSGYAVIVVERPGTGASFGKLDMDPKTTIKEADDILNWIAAQQWCDGNIGMFGDSIQAQIQFQAAASGNPHLKAIFPATTWMDNYSAVLYPGGVWDAAFGNFYPKAQKAFNGDMVTPVDQDQDGSLLAQARAERQNLVVLGETIGNVAEAPFRDTLTPSGKNIWVHYSALYPLLERINQSGIPVYLLDGWYDVYARDDFLIYTNLTVPKRLLVRPVDHSSIESPGADLDIAAEAHRWFDYWLKGIDNGIMDEPPIHYYLQGVGAKNAWQATDTWPLRYQVMTPYYFGPGVAAGRESTNSGTLAPTIPTDPSAADRYTVDYTTTTGPTPHWSGLAAPHSYPDFRDHDSRSLTYTTLPIEAATQVVGHPIAHVWLVTQAPDLDVFVYLEDVDSKGRAKYVTQGILRASHRRPGQAPFENFGLPWFDHFESELQPIPSGEPIELVFDLLPTAYQFQPGSRIRVTVSFADAGNFETPILEPAPTLQLLRDTAHPSYVELPVVKLP